MIFVTGGAFQGKLDFVNKNWPGADVADHLHLEVKKRLSEGQDPEKWIRELLEKDPDVIIISDMIGGGIIPMDPADNDWRETHGRICCSLAAHADAVYLVTCGIGQKIR